MTFSNTAFLMQHLPGRFVAEDKDGLLERYLSWFGDQLDAWDGTFDEFFESIQPATATAEWIAVWLDGLFGWSWFPWWFTLSERGGCTATLQRILHVGERDRGSSC